MLICTTRGLLLTAAYLHCAGMAVAQSGANKAKDPPVEETVELAKQLRGLDSRVIVLGTVRQPPLASMLPRDVEARLRLANRADRLAWEQVKTRADWERFRDQRVAALRTSLGRFPAPPTDLKVRITRTEKGDGFQVDNLVFQTRPGLIVTANLYRPDKPAPSMPGILFCHSHQSSKHSGARPDMAMTWARAGCVVLVPDHLGHGERRQHPFGDEAPHDYHFRYDSGMQLHLVGESLMGWLVWDLMRGVDLLLAQKGVDSSRILLVSEPAGGGDVAAVTAALDPRITCTMVQNFGGPEPETAYPLPVDAEDSFDFAGGGSFESTRNLRRSARDGFLPWVIVAAIAPRRLIYYHEFYWDRENDPVWKRLQRVYGFYDAADSLSGLAGRGFVVGSAPENSHWLPVNRELLYPVLERWLKIPNPRKEYRNPRPATELLCLTPEALKELPPQALHVLAMQVANDRTAAVRKERERLTPPEQKEQLRKEWTSLLGDVTPRVEPIIKGSPLEKQTLGRFTVERIHLGTEPGIVVPVLLLLPPRLNDRKPPVVIGLCQEGKQEFLQRRTDTIAALLTAGVAVCLPDLRGIGETSPGDGRDRRSPATNLSSSELMLGQSLLGNRLRDLRSVMRHLRERTDLDGRRLALWGDSFAPVNAPDRDLKVPHASANRPTQPEPLGGLLALLGALLEDDVQAVYVRGGLSDYRSTLQGPFCYLPHDVVVPGVLGTGDLNDVAAALAPRPLRLEQIVDGSNREVPLAVVEKTFGPTRRAYSVLKAERNLQIGQAAKEASSLPRWFQRNLLDE